MCGSRHGLSNRYSKEWSPRGREMSSKLYRPERDFLDVLKNVDAKGRPSTNGELFTFKELCSYLKEYIKRYQLFDVSDPKVVHCRDDPLGRVFDVSSFTLYEAMSLITKHVVDEDSPQSVQPEEGSTPVSQDVVTSTVQESDGHDTDDVGTEDSRRDCFTPPHVAQPLCPLGTAAGHQGERSVGPTTEVKETRPGQTSVDSPPLETAPSADRGGTSQQGHSAGGHGVKRKRHHRDSVCSDGKAACREGRSGEEERPLRRRASSISLVVDEWSARDGASYEWWQYVFPLIPSSDDSEILSIQSKETMLVKSSSDEAWSTEDELELAAASFDPPFTDEYDVESDEKSDSHGLSNSDSDSTEVRVEGVYIVLKESDVEWWADSESSDSESDFSTDSDLADEDKWTCEQCGNKNSPLRRNCDRCMVVRSNWLPPPRTRAPARPRRRKARALDLRASSSSGEDECDGLGGELKPQLQPPHQHSSRLLARTTSSEHSDSEAEERVMENVRTSAQSLDIGGESSQPLRKYRKCTDNSDVHHTPTGKDSSLEPKQTDIATPTPLYPVDQFKATPGDSALELESRPCSSQERIQMGGSQDSGVGDEYIGGPPLGQFHSSTPISSHQRTTRTPAKSISANCSNVSSGSQDVTRGEIEGAAFLGEVDQQLSGQGTDSGMTSLSCAQGTDSRMTSLSCAQGTDSGVTSLSCPQGTDSGMTSLSCPQGTDSGMTSLSCPQDTDSGMTSLSCPQGTDSGMTSLSCPQGTDSGMTSLSCPQGTDSGMTSLSCPQGTDSGMTSLSCPQGTDSGMTSLSCPQGTDSGMTSLSCPQGTDSGVTSLSCPRDDSVNRDRQRVSLSNFQIPLSAPSLKRGHSDPLPSLSEKNPSAEVDRLKKAKSLSSVEGAAQEGSNQLCRLCFSNPKNASIIHGNTGHQVCCYPCAKKLRRRGKTCPVCRQKIQKVVRNFIV